MIESMQTVNAAIRGTLAVIICPSCNQAKRINTAKLKDAHQVFKARCECGLVFKVQLDSRSYYRKQVNLPGSYTVIKGGRGGGTMHVHNISMGGVGFTVAGFHQLKLGQTVKLDFELSDKNNTPLSTRVIIKSVAENRIGSEFARDQAISKALGFFLRF